MENEKKNDAKQHASNPHKRNRRRGYFIEPAGDGSAPKLNQNQGSPAPTAQKQEGTEQKKQAAAPKKDNRQGRRPDQNEKRASSGQGGAPEKATAPQKAGGAPQRPEAATDKGGTPSAQGGGAGGSKSSRRRRNRHRNKSAGAGGASEPQVQKTTAEATAQKTEPKDSVTQNSRQKRGSDRLSKPTAEQRTVPTINEGEYDEIHFPSIHEDRVPEPSASPKEKPSGPMVEVVGIRFKSSGKTYYFTPGNKTVKRGECAIVETARGQEFGEVAMGNTMVRESDTVPPLRPILRVATEADKQHHKDNRQKEDEAFRICNERILAHGLDMKLIDAQYTFDNAKLLFYFTSSGRVDFRDLVKDLAGLFRTRIELRQIGIRDEAKLMGGMGMCGRPLCCNLFLSDFGQVSIKMAKEQNLSLNSAKISGICGRLMCCLRYEHETYDYEIKHTPPVDSLVRTADGIGTVTEIQPLRGTVKVRLSATPDTPPKVYPREDVVLLRKKTGWRRLQYSKAQKTFE